MYHVLRDVNRAVTWNFAVARDADSGGVAAGGGGGGGP